MSRNPSETLDIAPDDPRAGRWLWYASETDDCDPLDPKAYPSTIFDGRPIPLPPWVCRAPYGGLHANAAMGRLDIDVAEAPDTQDEWIWTCDYGVNLLTDSWLSGVFDLLDRDGIQAGRLRLRGEVVSGWSTLHESSPPPRLLATKGSGKICPNCGYSYTVLHGREYFADPTVLGRVIIVNSNGLFIREDIALSRNLRTPRGAYEPALVQYEPGPA